MAQVLHMDPSFPGGKLTPSAPPSLHGKEQEAPYSVETPYGYRLDLDFLKYVNDIEKGNTIKKVPGQRRPRYGSLPRGYGYTGSWWTSTESLCSNTSQDSRQSSFSYCAPGYHPHNSHSHSQRPSFSTARVEKTLLDARRKLEEEKEGGPRSMAGSTTSLSSAHSYNRTHGAGTGSFTPMSSGLSTPVSPTPAHLQHVREQMAVALRKIRELEEQVKTIPVLQVKISVLQEEKRQLSVQLKSQKFLGHTLGFGRVGRPRGELYIDIPEEEVSSGAGATTRVAAGPLSPTTPTTPEGSRPQADSGCEIEDTVIVGGSRPAGQREQVDVGIGVQEQDLELVPETEALKSQVGQLEGQLKSTMQELQAAQQQEQQGRSLQTVVSFTQQPHHRAQRTVGIQVYTLEQPATVVGVGTLLRAEGCSSPSLPPGGTVLEGTHRGHAQALGPEDAAVELPIAISSKQVREVLRSELSTSVPVTNPAIAIDTIGNQMALLHLKEGETPQHTAINTVQSQEDPSKPAAAASPQTALRSIMKRKAEGEPGSPSTKKNLQFTGVNGGYESTSSDDSSSESSEESDASEYHETTEKLPEAPESAAGRHQQAAAVPVSSTRLEHTTYPSPANDCVRQGKFAVFSFISVRLEFNESLMASLHALQKALGEPNAFSQQAARTAYTTVLQEWLRVSCHKAADTAMVRAYMDTFSSVSPQLLKFVVNMADGNGNTALHYTVSHSNFPVVKLLLDTGLCNADKQNKAGYTAIMLTALAAFHSDSDLHTVLQLLRTGDVNAKASQVHYAPCWTAGLPAHSQAQADPMTSLPSP
ncbi:unnamed protein product [Oncorhynchus mykiss]|uniref:KN motif and ankyrin repeat domain-containing protein 2 n=1 Tax=Oncorhynchus mykiss TaxID=8022 RepID=A0A060YKS8_ONCMY|nr:unnamed protein product [Oncorhynchus mykiss]